MGEIGDFKWMTNCIYIFLHESPVELIHSPRTSSSTLIMLIKDCLVCLSLPISQWSWKTYDGASNTSGAEFGVM